MEKNYSKREQDFFRDELFKRMDKQDNMLERIESQTLKTNGRVTRLEDRVADYNTYKAKTDELINFRWWIVGAVAAISLVGGTLGYFFKRELLNSVKETSQASVAEYLDNHFDIQTIK